MYASVLAPLSIHKSFRIHYADGKFLRNLSSNLLQVTGHIMWHKKSSIPTNCAATEHTGGCIRSPTNTNTPRHTHHFRSRTVPLGIRCAHGSGEPILECCTSSILEIEMITLPCNTVRKVKVIPLSARKRCYVTI
jgi:hypothetical protein